LILPTFSRIAGRIFVSRSLPRFTTSKQVGDERRTEQQQHDHQRSIGDNAIQLKSLAQVGDASVQDGGHEPQKEQPSVRSIQSEAGRHQ
jgi:hypothetical protein